MITRRHFIEGTAAATAGLALAGKAHAQAPAKRLIVDAQAHLWKAESDDWKWVPGMKPQLPEPFTIEKLVPLMDEGGIDRVVIVPPSWPGDRNDYALEAARRYPGRFAVMGRIPLQDPKSAALLPKWKEQPGMLGVRVTFLGPAAKWLTDGTPDWFWPAAEKAALPVMFLTAGNLKPFDAIAERHPQLPLIIDHMGLIADVVKAGKRDEVINDAAALAKYPNVSIKLSAAPANSLEPYPWKDMTSSIRKLYDAYGPRRCYWGTDLTNSFDKATYKQRITHFTETLDFMSNDDKDWVMGKGILARLGWA